ncbi:hypothetical protein DAEQUDRAFT_726326 [Daedalea quercina L-15889]|uniref:Cleavage/polyadenylation specificity factor A subunit N-terminal domain-containing protein n=1 Tax=Daedalea quercina L-15889 TaxID=1314783 RepID=A0A165QMS0_9APHY|nr:hypothetical protein DAEQUDRAFT_726326 [Daedalea quercina L-15889]
MQNGGRPLGEIHYVDVNPHHVVLCGENEVRVLSRENHTVVLRLSSEPGFARTILTPHLPPGSNKIPLIVRLETDVRSLAGEGHWGSFRAAHLSTSGHDLACMLADGRLVLVRHFERVVNGGTPIKDATLEVDLTHVNGRSGAQSEAGYYLAFEQDRVAIATSSGLYIMTLDAHTRGLLDPEALPRGHNSLAVGPSRSPDGPSSGALSSDVLVSWLPRLHDSAVLKEISCLQMSATCLYLTWKASRVDLVSRGASYGTFAVIYDEDPTFVDESTDYWTGRPMGSGLPVPIRRNPGLVVSCVDFSP